MNRYNGRLTECSAELDEQPAAPPARIKVVSQFSSLRIDLPAGTSTAAASRIARAAANAVRAIGHRFIETDIVNDEGEVIFLISNLNPRVSRARAVEEVIHVIRRIEAAD
jgi:carbamoylphosphate synthase large subunit